MSNLDQQLQSAAPPLTSHEHDGDLPVLLIEPSQGWIPLKLFELWTYRELIYFLAWRDVRVR